MSSRPHKHLNDDFSVVFFLEKNKFDFNQQQREEERKKIHTALIMAFDKWRIFYSISKCLF